MDRRAEIKDIPTRRSDSARRLKRQRGAIGGIPEQVLAIGVGTILVAGMVGLGNRAFTSSEAAQDVQTVLELAQQTRKLFSAMPTIANPANMSTRIIQADIDANGWSENGTASWNNRLGLVTQVIRSGGGNTFDIRYAVNDRGTCIQLLTKTPATGLTGLSGPGGAAGAIPPSPAQAQAACGTGNGNITWTFTK